MTNVGILGCGFAARLHATTLGHLRGRAQCWFASRESARGQQFCRRFRGAGYFGSYREAIDDPRIDVVLIATPPAGHLDLALAALGAGKDVIVEKPAFLGVADFDVVLRAERETGRRLLVAENYFYKPLARVIRSVIASGRIGQVLFVQINALKVQHASGWRSDPEGAGGGALFEGGIHWLDLLGNIGLEIDDVRALRAGGHGGPGESMLVAVSYREGAVGALLHSWKTPSIGGALQLSRISGTGGFIAFESNGLFALVMSGRRPRLVFPGFADISGRRAMWIDFLDALSTGRSPGLTPQRARRDLEIVERAYRSADGSDGIETSALTALRQRANAK